jgi:hypothetical protein
MRLEITTNESKQIDKVKKWSRLVLDCIILM